MARSWTTSAPPPDDAVAEAQIQERLRMARALREQSMQGASLENVGGRLIGNPFARAMTTGLKGFAAGQEEKQAMGEASALAQGKRERLTAALAGAGEAKTPDDMIAYGTRLLNDPSTSEVGQFYITAGQRAKERAQALQDKKYEETNADLRQMKTLLGAQDLQKQKAEDARKLAEYKVEHGQMAGMGTLYPTGNGYLQRTPAGWDFVTVDGKRPIPGAYDPNVNYNLKGAGAVGTAAGDQVAAGNPAIPPTPFAGGQPPAQPQMPPQGAAPQMPAPNAAPSAPPMAPPSVPSAPAPMAPQMPAQPHLPGLGYNAQQEVAKAGPIAGEKETFKEAAIARAALAKAEVDLPSTMALGEEILNHPGLADAVGFKGAPYLYGFRDKPFAGTDAAGFQTKYDTFMAKQFLQGYEVLKGGGQITEIEGEQARNAQVAMSQAQNEQEFKKALRDGMGAIKRGVEKLRRVAAMGNGVAGAPAAPAQPSDDDLVSKYLNGQP